MCSAGYSVGSPSRSAPGRVLSITKPTTAPLGVNLNEVLTVSIRRVAPGLSTFNDFRPQFFPLQCCGQIM